MSEEIEAVARELLPCPFCGGEAAEEHGAHRLRGEWFSPAPALLQYIEELSNGRAANLGG